MGRGGARRCRRRSASAPRARPRPGEVAGVGDRALLRVEEAGDDGDAVRYTGRVIKIIDRAKQRDARHLPRAAGRRRPARRRSTRSSSAASSRSRAGADAATRRTATWSRSKWRAPRSGFGLPTARVEERLGSLKSERAVSLIAIHAHGIPHVFPAGRPGRRRKPRSRRGLPAARTGAKCRSSPSIRPTPRTTTTRCTPSPTPIRTIAGGYVVTVAIADVAHYVRPGSALDREALHPRQLGLFPRPRGADAAGAHLQRPVLAAAGRGSRRARGAHGDRRRRPQALAHASTAC